LRVVFRPAGRKTTRKKLNTQAGERPNNIDVICAKNAIGRWFFHRHIYTPSECLSA